MSSSLTLLGQPVCVLGSHLTAEQQLWFGGPQPAPPQAVVVVQNTTTSAIATGQFYTDRGALAGRYPDRLFVGAATDNAGQRDRDIGPRDWLSDNLGQTSIGAWPLWGAQGASLARCGSIGWLGASRTSDALASTAKLGYTPSSIGVAAFALADDASNPTTTTAYAFYGHAIRTSGASYQPTFGMELEVENRGTLPTGVSHPYHINVGGGTYCLQMGAGGGQTTGTQDASAVLTVVTNPNSFQKGFVFKSDALSGTNGTASDTGFGAAMVMGRNQGLEWYAPDGLSAAIFRSTVTQGALGSRFEFQDAGAIFVSPTGYGLFSISNLGGARPYNTMQMFASTSPSLPTGIQVQALQGSNQNLALRPGQGGTLDLTATIGRYGAAVPSNANAGMLSLVVNGVTVLVPMFLPSQF